VNSRISSNTSIQSIFLQQSSRGDLHTSGFPGNQISMLRIIFQIIAMNIICGFFHPATAEETPVEATTISRDEWGVAHIHGKTHADAFFGVGYAQAEDYFWQLEDTCIRSLGRYAEVAGEDGIRSDILNRSFEVATRSQQDFKDVSEVHRNMAEAYVAGVNRWLETHPDEKPRLLRHFEPWYVLAMDRHIILDFVYRQAHVGKPENRGATEVAAGDTTSTRSALNSWDTPPSPQTGFDDAIRAAIGSNAWAISGRKTKSGAPMLFVNPHQPWYGMGQFYELHVSSDEGLNFTGASFFGSPFPTIGHNEHLGWTYTVNEPDIADAWRVTFDDPANSLNYRYAEGYRSAIEWQETLLVKQGSTLDERQVTFRKTHQGPIVSNLKDGNFLAVQVAGLFHPDRTKQAWGMVLAKDFADWRTAISHCAIPMFNVVYADNQNNIFYAYNGTIPKRDIQFDWMKPVDGSNPSTDWKGIHTFDELPQVLNPECGYVQSCNSSPFTTTESENPQRDTFPGYMIEDADVDMRRSKMSRLILNDASDLAFEEWSTMAYDTRMYWPMTEIPKLAADYESLKSAQPQLAAEVADYWMHLQDWDFQSSNESTQTTLVVAWYEQLYGFGYPAETLKAEFTDRLTWFRALKKAAEKLEGLYGTWKHPWGDAHRLQRIPDQPDVQHAGVGLNSFQKSLPCPGAPGPLGIIYTVYSSPEIPVVRPQRFSVVGASYMAVAEFGSNVQARSIMPFGASGRRPSPHFFDQAELYSARKFKPAWFHPDEVKKHTVHTVKLSRTP
jgi:acyl-homoserine-lactone acylase